LAPGQNRNGALIYQVPSERVIAVTMSEVLPSTSSAEIQGGQALPDWMTYDATTRTFTAIDPPPGALPLPVVVKLPTTTGQVISLPILLGEP
jgi:hypothetical protein